LHETSNYHDAIFQEGAKIFAGALSGKQVAAESNRKKRISAARAVG
jgi:hypothetical protein